MHITAIASKSVLGLFVCSLGLNVALSYKVDRLRPKPPKAAGALVPGISVPNITAKTIDGALTNIGFDVGKPTLIYVFKPECGWCFRNIDSIKALSKAAEPTYRIIGVSLTTTHLKEYMQQHQLPFDVYTDLDSASLKAFNMGTTPQTIVVSNTGHVIKDWLGNYGDANLKSINAFFRVSLPPQRAKS